MSAHRPWTKEEEEILIKNYPLDGRRCRDRLSGRTLESICRKATKLGIKRIYPPKIEMAQLHTPEFAYLLGFLWADGFIGKIDKSIACSVQSKDKKDISDVFLRTGLWTVRDRIDKIGAKSYPQTLFVAYDASFHKFLFECGYQNKSLKFSDKVLSILGPTLSKYFIHGLFDGDGHIRSTQYQLSISAHKDYDWSQLIEYLSVTFQTQSIVRRRKNVSTLEISQESHVINFYTNFIKPSPFGLSRKRDTFLSLFERTKEVMLKKSFVSLKNNKYTPVVCCQRKTFSLRECNTRKEARDLALAKHKELNSLFYQSFCNLQRVMGEDFLSDNDNFRAFYPLGAE